jgi:hypothetical protein
MQEADPMFFAPAIIGVLLIVGRIVPLVFNSINVAAFDTQINKLLAAGNRDRAMKLCRAAPHVPYIVVVKAMLSESKERSAKDGEGLVGEAIKEAHQRAATAQTSRVHKFGWLAPLGVVVAAGATFIAMGNQQETPELYVYMPPVIAVVIWVASLRKVARTLRQLQGAEGKYQAPLTAYVMERDSE